MLHTENSNKLTALFFLTTNLVRKNNTFIICSFCGSRVQAVIKAAFSHGGLSAGLREGPPPGSPRVADRIHFLVTVGLTAACFFKANNGRETRVSLLARWSLT